MANIYEKLQNIRVAVQDLNLKKTGENKFSHYFYFELGDFLPKINELMLAHKMSSYVSFTGSLATLTIVNIEVPEETVVFTSPMAGADLKGCHAIQNLGAVETYQRRYLYMTAFEIVENDAVEATPIATTPFMKLKNEVRLECAAKATENNGIYKAKVDGIILECLPNKKLIDATENDTTALSLIREKISKI